MNPNIESDLDRPQRQSIAGILIMFNDIVISMVKSFWPALIIYIVKFNPENIPIYLTVASGILLIVGFFAWLSYYFYTFYLDRKNQEFVVNKGVLRKRRITIQLDKIQQVNINQTLVQRLVNVYSLEIDTAGSNTKEVSIRAIDLKLANHLKEHLLIHADPVNSQDRTVDSSAGDKPFFTLSPSMLFRIGITTRYGQTLGLLVGLAFTLYGALYDIIQTFELDEQEVEGAIIRIAALMSVGFVFAVLVILMLVVNITTTYLRHYDFKMFLKQSRLYISAGLLARRNTIVRPVKVQIVSLSQNYFQKKLRFLDLKIRQATSAEQPGATGVIEIPGFSISQKNGLLEVLFGKTVTFDETFKPNYRYLVKAFGSGLIIPVLAYVMVSLFWFHDLFDYHRYAIGYGLVSTMFIVYRFRNYRLFTGSEFIAIQRGAWDITQDVFEPYKLQGITIKQMIWHKPVNLCHITFHTAAGDRTFRYLSHDRAKQLANRYLRLVESSKKAWM